MKDGKSIGAKFPLCWRRNHYAKSTSWYSLTLEELDAEDRETLELLGELSTSIPRVLLSLFTSFFRKKKPTADVVPLDTLPDVTKNRVGVSPPIIQETWGQGESERSVVVDIDTLSPLVNSSPRPQLTPLDA